MAASLPAAAQLMLLNGFFNPALLGNNPNVAQVAAAAAAAAASGNSPTCGNAASTNSLLAMFPNLSSPTPKNA